MVFRFGPRLYAIDVCASSYSSGEFYIWPVLSWMIYRLFALRLRTVEGSVGLILRVGTVAVSVELNHFILETGRGTPWTRDRADWFKLRHRFWLKLRLIDLGLGLYPDLGIGLGSGLSLGLCLGLGLGLCLGLGLH